VEGYTSAPAGQAICRIPLVAGTKQPLVVRWSSLLVDDPIWAETFSNHPECNVGYRLDDLVVIDCDSPERVTWWLEQGFPTDFVSRGQEDRRSFWYRQPEDDDPLETARFVDWEIRAGPGAQCAVPPSIHPCGRRYEWLGPAVSEEAWWEIPPAPADFLRDFVGEARRTNGNGLGAPGWSVVEPGGRDRWLASLGGFLRSRGMGEGAILDHLGMANQMECHPPLSAEAVARVAHSVARYDAGSIELEFDDGGGESVEWSPWAEPDRLSGTYIPTRSKSRL
jgi:hypothetical protein